MSPALDHAIVYVRDKEAAARFWTEIFAVPPAVPFGPFLGVRIGAVTFDLDEVENVARGHYAFLVSEPEFDEIFGRVRERGLPYSADPFGNAPGEINRHDGGRGVYFRDPSGHLLEILTRPYGSGGPSPGE